MPDTNITVVNVAHLDPKNRGTCCSKRFCCWHDDEYSVGRPYL